MVFNRCQHHIENVISKCNGLDLEFHARCATEKSVPSRRFSPIYYILFTTARRKIKRSQKYICI